MFGLLPIRLTVWLAIAGVAAAVAEPAVEPEDELKAAIVLSILRYAEWPRARSGVLVLGLVGAGSAAAALRRALNGKSIDSRPIRVIELKLVPDPNCCDAIYFATDKTAELSAALAAVARGEVLTIGESRDFLKLGGALNLLMVDGHMSFEVGLDALTQSHVGISSKLLRFGQLRGRKGGAT